MCDWEPVSMLEEKNRKARKPRRCTECRGAIAAGESYLSRRFLFEGAWSNHSVCQLCQRALSMIDDLSAKRNREFTGPGWARPDDCGPAFGELVDYLLEEDGLDADDGDDWPRRLVQAFVAMHDAEFPEVTRG